MKQQTKIPKLKQRQTEILHLLYTYRFLTRTQIQTFLHHKQFNRIIIWLNDLTKQNYIHRYYDQKFAPSTPAIYSLGLNGRKYLKQDKDKKINKTVLDRVWRESKLTEIFKARCIFLADIHLSLLSLTEKTKATLHFYTQTDLYGMDYMILDNPDAYFSIEEEDGSTKRYFLDMFDDVRPAILRGRVRQYLAYYDKNYWQNHTDKPFPEIILVCPTNTLKNHLFYYIQKKLERGPDLNFYLTTRELVKTKGLTKETLKKVNPKE